MRTSGAAERPRGKKRARSLCRRGGFLAVFGFSIAFAVVGVRIGSLALDSIAAERNPPQHFSERLETPQRSNILDRRGRLMAATVPAWSLYAHPREILDPRETISRLASVLEGLDTERLENAFAKQQRFVWVRRQLTPRQKKQVLALGLPGLYFGSQDVRVYPDGNLAAHVLGGVRRDNESVTHSDIIGVSGVERFLDDRLRNGGDPVRLSIDLRVQSMLRDEVLAGMDRYKAKGGAAVLMDVRSGELLGLVSLPDFDPNARPSAGEGDSHAEHATFNRTAQGVYELGSALKPVTAALAMERGGAQLDTVYNIAKPMRIGRYWIRDSYIREPTVTLLEAVYRSSNIAVAQAALKVGFLVQKEFLGGLGFLDRLPVELSEATSSQPLYPEKWRKVNVATIAYGHGIAITPLHLAAGYATLVGDGRKVVPTLLLGGHSTDDRPRIVSPQTVQNLRIALRNVVLRGTGRKAEVAGYHVAGKTGTADKALQHARGYGTKKVVSTFVSVFPAYDPVYVLVVSLDEPQGAGDSIWRRTAGNTAAPIAANLIRRAAPILGLPPSYEEPQGSTPDFRLARF